MFVREGNIEFVDGERLMVTIPLAPVAADHKVSATYLPNCERIGLHFLSYSRCHWTCSQRGSVTVGSSGRTLQSEMGQDVVQGAGKPHNPAHGATLTLAVVAIGPAWLTSSS